MQLPGSANEEVKSDRQACVHVLPRSFLLSMLIMEDLGPHVLWEFSSIMTSPVVEMNTWPSIEDRASIKQSLLEFMRCSGDCELADKLANCETIYDILLAFRTGTQKSKEWNRAPGPPSDEEKGPIDELDLRSPEMKSKEKFNRDAKPKTSISMPPAETFSPDYVRIMDLFSAIGYNSGACNQIGIQLVNFRHKNELERREEEDNLFDFLEQVREEEKAEANKTWTELCNEALTRSSRSNCAQLGNANAARPRVQSAGESPPVPCSSRTAKDDEDQLKRRGGGNVCAKVGCEVKTQESGYGGQRIRVPKHPGKLSETASLNSTATFHRKRYLHLEAVDRLGYGRNVVDKELRLCSCHPFETYSATIRFNWRGDKYTQRIEITTITGKGALSSALPSEKSKGTAVDRRAVRELEMLNNLSAKKAKIEPAAVPVTPAPLSAQTASRSWKKRAEDSERKLAAESIKRARAEGEVAESKLMTYQILESQDREKFRVPSMKALLKVGEEVVRTPGKRASRSFTCEVVDSRPKKVQPAEQKKKPKPAKSSEQQQQPKPPTASQPPCITMLTSDREVKRRTGYSSMKHMLAAIIIFTNGDAERMRKWSTPLTWLEEWFLYFEWIYHKSFGRMIDFEAVWKQCPSELYAVIDSKLAIVAGALQSWPMFPSFEEDHALRKNKWQHYNGSRAIFWDMTNVSGYQPSDARAQRMTYSEYYGENCLKAGIGIMLCGWLLVAALWGGGVSDTDYNQREGYLDKQDKFAQKDLVDGEVVTFLNILDRGFRAKMAAWEHGRQLALQPPQTKSDERFRGSQTVYSAGIATDRAGNERGVNVSKRSDLFGRRGFNTGTNVHRFQRAWLVWSFQANFMYDPVL